MRFYGYEGNYPLGKEPLGTLGKILIERKTVNGAIRFTKKCFGNDFTLYSFTNLYDDKTFKKVYPKG